MKFFYIKIFIIQTFLNLKKHKINLKFKEILIIVKKKTLIFLNFNFWIKIYLILSQKLKLKIERKVSIVIIVGLGQKVILLQDFCKNFLEVFQEAVGKNLPNHYQILRNPRLKKILN